MGSYNETFVCKPPAQSPWWAPVVFLQFVIVILGCISHVIFVKLAVVPRNFGRYIRVAFALISAMMLNMLLTSTGAFVITLMNGKFIEDCEISAMLPRKWLLYIHSFGEYFFVVCELLGTIERVISTYYPNFRKSDAFTVYIAIAGVLGISASFAYIYFIRISFVKHLFAIGFGSLTAMEILNGIIVFILLHAAKRKYKNSKDATLNFKFEISQSYSYCRCAAASVIARVFIITFVYLQVFGLFEGSWGDSGFYYVMNILINLYCLVYPWAIMLCHRKIRGELSRIVKESCLGRNKKVHIEGEQKKLYTIDGRHMNSIPDDHQKSHFNNLGHFWNSSAQPTARGAP
ncbi:hypothetical protein B9Z55_016762 [Caenorhabditis nigoni]|uniref:G-protein coupled receptors family 1 profile domain-containing protein n=1 Tax=Caenorhabditis nigoni TaxID=1611254 RepID=A0A2G5T6X7_9PELO|nr:hypothetical protein B9Z55_016762 [Caenorhabditis nigoni]